MRCYSILPPAAAFVIALLSGLCAQNGADPEADKVATEIKELRELFEQGSGKNNDRALTAIRNAMATPKATYEFYMESRKKLDFDEAGKRESEWRKWREENEDRYKKPEHLRARQFQLRYLALSVQASAAGDDDTKLAALMPKLNSFLDDMTGAASEIGDQRGVLDKPVMGSTFARRMKLDLTIDPDIPWCFAPLDVSEIYDRSLLPFHRRAKDASAIASAWDKRMLHEAKVATLPEPGAADKIGDIAGVNPDDVEDLIARFRGRGSRDREREERRETERKRGQGEEGFKKERLPELKWGKARDALVFGTDRTGNLRAMASLFKANLNHEKAREWIDELTTLSEQSSYDPEEIYGK